MEHDFTGKCACGSCEKIIFRHVQHYNEFYRVQSTNERLHSWGWFCGLSTSVRCLGWSWIQHTYHYRGRADIVALGCELATIFICCACYYSLTTGNDSIGFKFFSLPLCLERSIVPGVRGRRLIERQTNQRSVLIVGRAIPDRTMGVQCVELQVL